MQPSNVCRQALVHACARHLPWRLEHPAGGRGAKGEGAGARVSSGRSGGGESTRPPGTAWTLQQAAAAPSQAAAARAHSPPRGSRAPGGLAGRKGWRALAAVRLPHGPHVGAVPPGGGDGRMAAPGKAPARVGGAWRQPAGAPPKTRSRGVARSAAGGRAAPPGCAQHAPSSPLATSPAGASAKDAMVWGGGEGRGGARRRG
jgi:hypothetical protein